MSAGVYRRGDGRRNRDQCTRRRGVIIVQVAVGMTAIIGFATLAIDVGLMYSSKAQLQNVADAAALAAAAELGNFQKAEELQTTTVQLATDAAIDYAGKNEVLGESLDLGTADIEFGFSTWNDQSDAYDFEAAAQGETENINGVRIWARRTSGSSNGPIDLLFAGIFGHQTADMQVKATAILVPRDIIIVADLSGSYNDDSEIKSAKLAGLQPDGINLYQVWQTMPKTSADGALLEAWLDANPGSTVEDAPSTYFEASYGFFSQLGSSASGSVPIFGATTINSSWNPSTDSGLVYLNYKTQWNSAALGATNYNNMRSYLSTLGYSDLEIRCIMADNNASFGGQSASTVRTNIKNADDNSVTYKLDGTTLSQDGSFQYNRRYDFRTCVALGLVYWNSGISGGKWQAMGWSPGDADYYIEDTEMKSAVAYPYPSGNWYQFATYVRDDETTGDTNNNANAGIQKFSSLKFRFGAKHFTNFLLEIKEAASETDVTNYAYSYPLHLTKDALKVLMDDLVAIDSSDHIGLVTFGTDATLDYALPCDDTMPGCADPIDLATNTTAIEDMYRHRQAAHYTSYTNIGEGLEFAMNCLNLEYSGYLHPYQNSPDFSECHPRPDTQKVIVLLTDGIPNRGPAPDYTYDQSQDGEGQTYAFDVAADAWDQYHMKTYAIGVGAGADQYVLDSIAENGHTTVGYWANGDWATIESELEDIFQKIGGRRPVQLID
ncbi:MAG: hypothetical protein HJJLKODD_00263 [Phycisphaerae bacterium]|nr:hypothetical protein [Phycisphaerae bacterium]